VDQNGDAAVISLSYISDIVSISSVGQITSNGGNSNEILRMEQTWNYGEKVKSILKITPY